MLTWNILQTIQIIVPPSPLLSLDYIDNVESNVEIDGAFYLMDDMIEPEPEFKDEVDSEETLGVVHSSTLFCSSVPYYSREGSWMRGRELCRWQGRDFIRQWGRDFSWLRGGEISRPRGGEISRLRGGEISRPRERGVSNTSGPRHRSMPVILLGSSQ